jgi:hypothetical protein
MTTQLHIRAVSTNRSLIAAAPLIAFLQQLEDECSVRRRRHPNGEVVLTLESIKVDLQRAIEAATSTTAYVTIDGLHKLTSIPRSTLRRECAAKGKTIGAIKQHGQWLIDWTTYERAMQLTSTMRTN